MFRICFILTLSFSLLACPLRCITATSTDGQGSAPKCKCCHKHSPVQQNGKAPAAPDNDTAGNCLCHGAIVASDAPELPTSHATHFLPLGSTKIDPPATGLAEADGALHFRPPNTGQQTRIQLASLLL